MADEIRQLYESGNSGHMIARDFGVHFSTIYDCLRRMKVEIRSIKEAGILASEKGRIPIKHVIPESSRKMSKKKAYILGVMCGDGYIHRTKKDSYQIALQAVDRDFVRKFANCMNEIYGLRPSLSTLKATRSNWNDKLQARICCKEVFVDISHYGPFGKYEWAVPSVILNSSDDIKSSFLKGFFDSEGSVDTYKKIIAVSVNKTGIHEIEYLLSSLGIKSNVREVSKLRGNRRRQYTIKITGRRFLELYSQKIGFSIGRKQECLENLIKGYKFWATPHTEVVKLENRMVELRRKGTSYQNIANELNLSIGTVWRNLNK